MWKLRSSALSDISGSGVRATIAKMPLKRSSTILLCSCLPNSCGWPSTELPSFSRTHDAPDAIMGSVRKGVSEFDPGAVVYAVETMNDVLANSMAARRLSMILLAAFAMLALALSCIGMYGVLSYLAGERTREIGVRMALGAQRRDIQRLILGQGAKMAIAGVVLGIFLALGSHPSHEQPALRHHTP